MAERRLLHYSAQPLGEVRDVPDQELHFKPRGLWLSVEGEDDWPSRCRGLDRLACVSEIILHPEAKILRLSSAADIDELTQRHATLPPGYPAPPGLPPSTMFMDWRTIADQYDGIIIAPYIWSRRVRGGADWYYAWHCASGCIWRASAIQRVELLKERHDG